MSSKSFYILLVFVCSACGLKADDGTEQLLADNEAIITPLTHGDIQDIVPSQGEVSPINSILVGSEISGIISAVHVDFNQPVNAGDLLAEINPEPFIARIEKIESQLISIQSDLEYIQAEILNLKRKLHRRSASEELGFSPEEIDDLKLSLASMENQKNKAESRHDELRTDKEAAEKNLQRTKIISPIDGFVLDKKIEEGQTINAGFQTPVLFNIAQSLDRVLISAEISEIDINRIREGVDVSFSTYADPEKIMTGEVLRRKLVPKPGGKLVYYTIDIVADNPEKKMYPGMSVSVNFINIDKRKVLRAPISALYFVPKPAAFNADTIPDNVREKVLSTIDENNKWAVFGALNGGEIAYLYNQNRRRIFILSDGNIISHGVQIGAQNENFVEIVKPEIDPGANVLSRSNKQSGSL